MIFYEKILIFEPTNPYRGSLSEKNGALFLRRWSLQISYVLSRTKINNKGNADSSLC